MLTREHEEHWRRQQPYNSYCSAAVCRPRKAARSTAALRSSAHTGGGGGKERPCEHSACAARGCGAHGAVCESQRARGEHDVDFVSHWCSRRERMESQVRCVVGIVFIDSISCLPSFFPLFTCRLLLVCGRGRGRVFAFCGGLGGGLSVEIVQSALCGRLDVWPGVAEVWGFVGARRTTRYKAQRSVEEI